MNEPQVLYVAVPTTILPSSLIPLTEMFGGAPQLVTLPGSHDAAAMLLTLMLTGPSHDEVPAFHVHLPMKGVPPVTMSSPVPDVPSVVVIWSVIARPTMIVPAAFMR